MNTLTAALAGGADVRIRHTENFATRIDSAARMFNKLTETFEKHQETSVKLAKTKVDQRFVDAYIKALLPGDSTRAKNNRAAVSHLVRSQPGAFDPAIKDTAWGVYNAFVDYVDHHGPRNRTREQAERRFCSVMDGNADRQKQVAYQLVCKATGADGSQPLTFTTTEIAANGGRSDVDQLLASLNI